MAALINEINQREARHIVIIEDPIEYEHTHIRSVVEQVEIGAMPPIFPPLCARHCVKRPM
jgi:twitching motility protein PilT